LPLRRKWKEASWSRATQDSNHYTRSAGWRNDERTKEKALKSNWLNGELKEGWKSKTKTVGRKSILKDGNLRKSKNTTNSTVVFVPSTKEGLLVRKLREDEETMAGVKGFRIKFQEAGRSKLKDSFYKDLGKGKHWEDTKSHAA
jgi:hypothetical protein